MNRLLLFGEGKYLAILSDRLMDSITWGIAIHVLQQQLGHNDLHSTLHSLHWLPNYHQGQEQFSDLMGRLVEDRGHD